MPPCNQPVLAALARVREQAVARAMTAGVYGRAFEAAAHLQAADNASARLRELGDDDLVGVLASEVQRRPARWLWGGRLRTGTLAILQGDPKIGKSTLATDLAARVTRGDAFPLDSDAAAEGGVIIAGHEDTTDDVATRLEGAGAVLCRVRLLRSAPRLPEQIPALERLIRSDGARLVVMERATEILGGKAAAVTAALAPLADMAERTDCVVLLLRHLTKRRGADILAGQGSISGSGIARSILTYDSDAAGRRLLRCATNADGPPASDLIIVRGSDGRLLYEP